MIARFFRQPPSEDEPFIVEVHRSTPHPFATYPSNKITKEDFPSRLIFREGDNIWCVDNFDEETIGKITLQSYSSSKKEYYTPGKFEDDETYVLIYDKNSKALPQEFIKQLQKDYPQTKLGKSFSRLLLPEEKTYKVCSAPFTTFQSPERKMSALPKTKEKSKKKGKNPPKSGLSKPESMTTSPFDKFTKNKAKIKKLRYLKDI